MKPTFVKKILSMKRELLEENGLHVGAEPEEEDEEVPKEPPPARKERVLSQQSAFLMTRLLQSVVEYGTGQGAKALGRPAAGKTGTSSDFTDAWFIGYTPSLLTSVWVGFDNKASLGENETGARAALPIWISFMKQALRNTPVENFKAPEDVILAGANLGSQEPVASLHVSILGASVDRNQRPPDMTSK